MEDGILFGTFMAGGFGVLVSYMFLYFQNSLPDLYRRYTKTEWRLWFTSMILTVASVIGVIVWFSFYERLKYRDLFISSLCVFLAFAMLWSLSIFYIFKNKKSPSIQVPILMVVGLATIGMFIPVISTTDNWLLILAAFIIVFHHLVIDGLYWPYMHSRKMAVR
jgi:hypothetical protein